MSTTLRGVRPTDLQPLAEVPTTDPAELGAVIARARAAQPAWEALGFEERLRRLKVGAAKMLERRAEAAQLLYDEAGKHAPDSILAEALGPLDYLKGWAKVARRFLRPRTLPINRLAFPGKHGRVEMVPRGVVGIIAPWNYPLGTFFKPVFPALLCGNTIVVKPSELSPRTGQWFRDVLASELPPGVFEVVQGGREVGEALIKGGIDALTFTGSVPTGRAILKLCADQMIPCSAELGGKDPALVLADCDLTRTVAGVLYWGLHNCGQDCGAIERVYVEEAIADEFIARLGAAARRLNVDPQKGPVDVPPLANERQLRVVEAHVDEALAKGARALAGGKRTGRGFWFEPTVLEACTHEMKVVSEETFGPVLAVMRVKDAEEAIARANDSRYGLNASIWTKDLARGEALAKRLEAGSVFINNHALTGAMPIAPWTGVKESGYGIANSEHALSHYTRPKTLLVDRSREPDPWWYPVDALMAEIADRLARAQLGSPLAALKVPGLFSRRRKKIRALASKPPA